MLWGALLLQEVEILEIRKWKVSGHFGKYCDAFEKPQRLRFDDHWTFQQDNHAKVKIQIYLRLIQGSSLNGTWGVSAQVSKGSAQVLLCKNTN